MTYGQEYYKKWYAANREKQLLWQKEYYENHKEHVLQMHKNWAQKNVDQGGSVWRKYGRRRRTMMIAAWANFMRAGEFNPPHIHSRCDFSSVLFINVPESLKEEHKKFNGTGGGPGAIAFTYGESQPFSINHKHYFPQEGELFIFPATLTHYVSSFGCKEERISISANFRLD